MNSLFYVSAVSVHGPGICCRTVPIGGPSVSNEPNSDVDSYYGNLIKIANDKGKDILSVHDDAECEVSVHKGNGEVTASGAYTNFNNGFKTFSVYNGELCASLATGETFVLGSGSLTADDEQKTISLINAKDEQETVSVISGNFHSIPGKGTLLNGDKVSIYRRDYPMRITASGRKADDDAEAKLDIDENKDTVSLSGRILVFEHGKASISATDGDARIDVPNDYTSLTSESVVLRYDDQAEIFASDIKMCVDHAECKIYMSGSNANFRIGEENRFIQDVKNACIDLATGKVYCNGEVLCYAPMLKQLGKQLFKADPKPVSALTS